MNRETLNRIRAMRQSGFGKRDIARLVGVPYREVNLAVGDTTPHDPVKAEAIRLLKAKRVPKWFPVKDWDTFRECVESNFCPVGEV